MTTVSNPGRIKRPFLLLSFLLLIFLTSACAPDYKGLKPPIKRNTVEWSPAGHKIDVTQFQWKYIDGGRAIQVDGRVHNNTGRDHRPIVLYCMLFDETGLAVGVGDVTVNPRTLPKDGNGNFCLKVATSRPNGPKPIKYIRLLTNAQND